MLLPIQIICNSKANHCHSKFGFPEEFNITLSVNHWSNEEMAVELIGKILLLYGKKKIELGLCSTQEWFLIANVFRGQWTEKVECLIEKNNLKVVPVPHNTTNFFQPRSSETKHKHGMPSKFKAISRRGIVPESVPVNLQISTLKPLQAKWITQKFNFICTDKDILKNR